MRRYILWILLVALLAAWAVFLDRATDFFIFEPSRQVYSLHTLFTEVSFPTEDGTPIYALYTPAQEGKPTLLFFHGNKSNIYSVQDLLAPYVKEGLGVLTFDYRGYGKSAGRTSEKNFQQDSRAALFYLINTLHIMPKDIVLFGFALGSYPALYTAVQYEKLPFRALILQCPFTTMPDMGFYRLAKRYDGSAVSPWILLLRPILWNKTFDNTRLIGRVRAPLLIGCSRQDNIIPWTMSRALTAKAPHGTKQFFADLGPHYSSDWMVNATLQFLNTLSPLPPAHE